MSMGLEYDSKLLNVMFRDAASAFTVLPVALSLWALSTLQFCISCCACWELAL